MAATMAIASICRGLPGPLDPSGGIFVFRRLEAMARQARVTTLQPVPYFPLAAPLPKWARSSHHEWEGVHIEHVPMLYLPKYLKFLDGFWLCRSVRSRLAELKKLRLVDVVDAHFGYPEGVGALRAARELGIPAFVTLRGFEAEYVHKPLIGGQIRNLIQNADGCICVAEFLRKIALDHGAKPEKVRVIHNAIDRRQFYPGDRTGARVRTGLPQGIPIVISVGHVIPRKRHHVLIAAFAKTLKAFPKARLLIVGGTTFDRDYLRRLHRQIRQSGVAEAVEFLGNVGADMIADLLRSADVFALGTEREGCCNAVLEALACGLPVVTTPVGDNSHFVKDGENGYLVPVDDTAGMHRGLRTALERVDWSADRISSGLKISDWDEVASQICNFFLEGRKAMAKDRAK